ncbi:hypothetical protein BJQ89_03255 [Arthrobacter sp. ES1]|nr:hypothetical protein [Arthrobacter sp. ES1]
MVIDGHVDVVIADTSASDGFGSAVDPPASAVRDFPELLHVDMQQFSGGVAFVAVVGCPAGADAFAADRVQFP